MELADRFARACASARQVDIENKCAIAGRPDLVGRFLSSDRSLSEVIRELLQLRALDQIIHSGAGAVLPN